MHIVPYLPPKRALGGLLPVELVLHGGICSAGSGSSYLGCVGIGARDLPLGVLLAPSRLQCRFPGLVIAQNSGWRTLPVLLSSGRAELQGLGAQPRSAVIVQERNRDAKRQQGEPDVAHHVGVGVT